MNVQVAATEYAILDMVGNIANKLAGLLIGELQRDEVPIYLGYRYTNLGKPEPEESLELMYQDALETKAKAVKLRAELGDYLANGTSIPIESKAEPFESIDGAIKVTSVSDPGIHIDPDYIKTHQVVTS